APQDRPGRVDKNGMAHRRAEGAVLDFDDQATRWKCVKCGYGNIGRERCIDCGAKAPVEVQALGGLHVDVEPVAPTRSAVAGRRAGRTVAALIGLNVAFQVVLAAIVISNGMDLASAVRLSLVAGLFF